MQPIQPQNFTQALTFLLEETFESVHGIYLDRGNSLFETLAQVSAAEASIPVGGRCATLAAQVKHVAFYLEVVVKQANDPNPSPVNWREIWDTVHAVTADEWAAIQAELRQSYQRIRELTKSTPNWDDVYVLGGAMGLVAHTAYHLGEIRQALCVLQDSAPR
jgi:hypothetical protein